MTLEELFEKYDKILTHRRRAATKRPRKLVNNKILNPEALSPEAYRYYAKETTGVQQNVTVTYTRNGTFIYISHSKFK